MRTRANIEVEVFSDFFGFWMKSLLAVGDEPQIVRDETKIVDDVFLIFIMCIQNRRRCTLYFYNMYPKSTMYFLVFTIRCMYWDYT